MLQSDLFSSFLSSMSCGKMQEDCLKDFSVCLNIKLVIWPPSILQDGWFMGVVGLNNVPLVIKPPSPAPMCGQPWVVLENAVIGCFVISSRCHISVLFYTWWSEGTSAKRTSPIAPSVFMMQPANLSMTAKCSHRNPLLREREREVDFRHGLWCIDEKQPFRSHACCPPGLTPRLHCVCAGYC